MESWVTICLLSRRPRLGQGKSRLARELGPEAALAIQWQLLERCCHTLDQLPPPFRVSVHWTGEASGFEARTLPPWALPGAEQPAGELGARMAAIVEESLAHGSRAVILLGSDCPWLEAQDLHDAARALERTDCVLGPAEDGGYWLIGARRWHPGLFPDTVWGGPTVLQDTRDSLAATGLDWSELRTLPDVDRPDDWTRWQEERNTHHG
ncbi:MAG: TIGR04282 family arsenosugar biosynthesis glycosyltransferase [Candidatus Delongbacteria bacterium]|nr:TIGR04282 family arsenosugar biosynthesis glycosyltransferase [Candidatus Delongbacteria bacterium]